MTTTPFSFRMIGKETPLSPITLPRNRFRHLLCDLDGTLIDSGGLMVHFEFIGRTLPLMKKHQGWATAYQALKAGAETIKKPSKTKTNHERMIENFARHFKIDYPQAEKEVRANLQEVFPKLKSHFGKIQGQKTITLSPWPQTPCGPLNSFRCECNGAALTQNTLKALPRPIGCMPANLIGSII